MGAKYFGARVLGKKYRRDTANSGLSGRFLKINSKQDKNYITERLKIEKKLIKLRKGRSVRHEYAESPITIKGVYKGWSMEGAWEIYYENEQLKEKGIFKNSFLDGSWECYYEDGQLEEKGFYNDGYQDGLWKYFARDGSLVDTLSYKNCVLEHFINGKLVSRGNFAKEEGPWVLNPGSSSYRPNDVDRKKGYWEEFHKDGSLASKGNYNQNGVKKDLWEYYYPNGNVSSKGNYKYGQKDGIWEFFYEDGSLEKTETWKNGELVE